MDCIVPEEEVRNKFNGEKAEQHNEQYMMGSPAPIGPGEGARHNSALFLGDGSVLDRPQRICACCGTKIFGAGGLCPNC